jgi:hypothetical protein
MSLGRSRNAAESQQELRIVASIRLHNTLAHCSGSKPFDNCCLMDVCHVNCRSTKGVKGVGCRDSMVRVVYSTGLVVDLHKFDLSRPIGGVYEDVMVAVLSPKTNDWKSEKEERRQGNFQDDQGRYQREPFRDEIAHDKGLYKEMRLDLHNPLPKSRKQRFLKSLGFGLRQLADDLMCCRRRRMRSKIGRFGVGELELWRFKVTFLNEMGHMSGLVITYSKSWLRNGSCD